MVMIMAMAMMMVVMRAHARAMLHEGARRARRRRFSGPAGAIVPGPKAEQSVV